MTAAQDASSPAFIKNLMCDKLTAYTACQAISSALYIREKTGKGQHIDLSMLDAAMFFLFPDAFGNHTLLDDDVERKPLLSDLLYEMTLTKDGGLTISAATEVQRAGVYKALGLESMMEDERFTPVENLLANIGEYRAILTEAFSQITTDDALQKLQEQDVPCARCYTLDEAISQEQLIANDSDEVQDHPVLGKLRAFRTPARFEGKSLPIGGPAPMHGQHTDSTLESFGFSSEQITNLRKEGAIS